MLRLTSLKPLPVPREPKTLDEHLRKRRFEEKWQQKEVALRLGVNQWTYITWEKDQHEPSVRYMPRIFEFLGYDPFPGPTSLGERIVAKRRSLGLPRKHLAKRIGVDEGTLRRWEKGQWRATRRTREKRDAFMK